MPFGIVRRLPLPDAVKSMADRFMMKVKAARPLGDEDAFKQLAPKVAAMAKTGVGTDACLEHGALPMPVHFYSPVPDIPDLRRRGIWDRRSSMAGIDLRIDRQLELLEDLGKAYSDECNWPYESADPLQFQTNNSGFSYGCAAGLHCLIRRHKPSRVIEVGSGNSTRVIAAALRANKAEGTNCHYVVVDPYPAEDTQRIAEISKFEIERVELIDPSLFDALGENDILFVDSGHTVRIGGDVNFLILDVLSRLRPGVLVHFHDIPMPLEYNEVYFTNPAFRMFWTESYLLQAFLSLNESYEILLSMALIFTDYKERFQQAFPHYDPDLHVFNSSSFWIRRLK